MLPPSLAEAVLRRGRKHGFRPEGASTACALHAQPELPAALRGKDVLRAAALGRDDDSPLSEFESLLHRLGHPPAHVGIATRTSLEPIDHNLDLALALSDSTVALERGRVIHQGPSRDLRDDLDLRRKVLWL